MSIFAFGPVLEYSPIPRVGNSFGMLSRIEDGVEPLLEDCMLSALSGTVAKVFTFISGLFSSLDTACWQDGRCLTSSTVISSSSLVISWVKSTSTGGLCDLFLLDILTTCTSSLELSSVSDERQSSCKSGACRTSEGLGIPKGPG